MKSVFLPFLLCLASVVSVPGAPAPDPLASHPATDSTDGALRSRRDALSARVSQLRPQGAEGSVRSFLEVALERAKACEEAGCGAEAKALLDDVEAALVRPVMQMTVPGSDTATVSAIKPPRVIAGNPYLARLLAGARKQLAAPDKPWPKSTDSVNPFSGINGETGSRSVGEEMCAWLWLYDNPASPMKGDPKVLARFLRLAHAYAYALDVHEADHSSPGNAPGKDKGELKAGQGILDDFAIAPASSALREFAQLHPGLLLPSQKSQWDRAMANGGRVMWGKAKDRKGDYANIYLALSFELLNFGLYLNKPEYLEKSRFLAEVQTNSLYPDGAIAYLGHQNESNHYHDADTHYLARIYAVSGNQKVLDLLRRTEWYGPVSSGKMGEFWTVPSWKDTWNSMGSPTGGEEVASITGNPYLCVMRDHGLAKAREPDVLKGWFKNYAPLPWFRNDVKPLPLPDNYTVIDRNIAGPRAWYGRFNYAATLRPIPVNESGLGTIMGAQLTDTNGGFGQILMGVCPRIRENPAEITKSGKFDRGSFAWRTHGLASALVMGRTWSALMADYRLQQYRSASAGNPVDWKGRQLWLGLPDRIIGLVEVFPTTEGAKAIDVEGVLRLGTGGTVNGHPVKIARTGNNEWKYGDLIVTFAAYNGAAIQAKDVPYRLPKYPNTEIRVLDARGAAASDKPAPYPASFNQWFLVEVRPASAKAPAVMSRITEPAGLLGFAASVGERRFLVLGNPGASDLSVPSGQHLPGATLHGSDDSVSPTIFPALVIRPGELAVLVDSRDQQDHLKGWSSYQEMVSPNQPTRLAPVTTLP